MRDNRQAIFGIIAGLLSTLIVLGSFILAMAEGDRSVAMAFTPTNSPSALPPVYVPIPDQPIFTPSLVNSPTPTPESDVSSICPAPGGWQQIAVQPGDTLASLAQVYGISVETLITANCLPTQSLIVGVTLYVPSLPPSATSTLTLPPPPTVIQFAAKPCGHPAGWVNYTVKKGDTLYSIARAHAISVAKLKSANCLTSDLIRGGQRLVVPNIPAGIPADPATSVPEIPTGYPKPVDTYSPPSPTNSFTFTPMPATTEPATATSPPTAAPVTPTNTTQPTVIEVPKATAEISQDNLPPSLPTPGTG